MFLCLYLHIQISFFYFIGITSSYYKVVVFIDSLQGLYAILLEILWIVYHPLPLDGL